MNTSVWMIATHLFDDGLRKRLAHDEDCGVGFWGLVVVVVIVCNLIWSRRRGESLIVLFAGGEARVEKGVEVQCGGLLFGSGLQQIVGKIGFFGWSVGKMDVQPGRLASIQCGLVWSSGTSGSGQWAVMARPCPS